MNDGRVKMGPSTTDVVIFDVRSKQNAISGEIRKVVGLGRKGFRFLGLVKISKLCN